MMAKNRVFLAFLLGGLWLAFGTGCAGVTPNPGSERVRVFETEPKNCIYIGEVSSLQKDRELGTLETEMSLETRVDLRNKAHKLGGNILVFMKGKSSNILPGGLNPVTASGTPAAPAPAATEDGEEPEVPEKPPLVFLGTVFKCPSSILNQ